MRLHYENLAIVNFPRNLHNILLSIVLLFNVLSCQITFIEYCVPENGPEIKVSFLWINKFPILSIFLRIPYVLTIAYYVTANFYSFKSEETIIFVEAKTWKRRKRFPREVAMNQKVDFSG